MVVSSVPDVPRQYDTRPAVIQHGLGDVERDGGEETNASLSAAKRRMPIAVGRCRVSELIALRERGLRADP